MCSTPSQKFPQRCIWNGSNVHLIDDGPLSSFLGRSSRVSSFSASLLQVISGVMSLALCPQVVSQASQHFRSSEKQATYEGCFARQSIYLVISIHPGMSKAVHPQEFSKVDVDHQHIPVRVSHFTFSSKLIESVFYFWKQCPPGLTSLLPGYLQLYYLLCHSWKEPTVVQGAPSADLLYKGLLQADPVDHFLRHQAGNLRLLFHHYCVTVHP